jgi:pilus assembly protein CpaF
MAIFGRRDSGGDITSSGSRKEVISQLKERVHSSAYRQDIGRFFDAHGNLRKEILWHTIENLADTVCRTQGISLSSIERKALVNEIVQEIIGLGPMEMLLQDPSVSEIMVNGPKQVYVERSGRLELTSVTFKDESELMHYIEKILSPLNRRVNEAEPYVDARLDDGSRVNVIIPPLSLTGPVLTIYKFSREKFRMEDLIRFGTLSPKASEFLKACIQARLNILVAGGTSAGKTTLLGTLSQYIPENERVIVIEDTAELQLERKHMVRLETRMPSLERRGEVTLRDLVRNALHMRPDRIIIGEVRGQECLDMLQAMNTGHDGSMTTLHANSALDALGRIETMALLGSANLTAEVVRRQVISAIDLIIFQSRFPDGSRRTTQIAELIKRNQANYEVKEIFALEEKGFDSSGRVSAVLKPTGLLPEVYHRIEKAGKSLSHTVFSP